MKAVSTILFTVLYALFSCFAVTGFAAAKCPFTDCNGAAFSYKEKGVINTDDTNDNCTHQLAVTAHIVYKQTSNPDSSGNKYLLSSSNIPYKNSFSSTVLYKQERLYSKAVTSASCPLFIKHCVLLI